MLQRGERARGNARAALQALSSNARQGCTPNRVALRFPSLTRGAQHRALARTGVAHNKRQIPLARDVLKSASLLVPKSPIAQRRILRRCADAVAARFGEAF